MTQEWPVGALTEHGPLWALGEWNSMRCSVEAGEGHVIVLTGVDNDGTVYFNDPAREGPDENTVDWADERLRVMDGVSIMYLASSR